MKSRRSIERLDILCVAFTFSAKYEMNNKSQIIIYFA